MPVDERPSQGPPPPPARSHAPQTSGITDSDSSYPGFQPAGYLPPPPGWNAASSPPPPYPYPQQQSQQAPVVVNQHYYMLAPPTSNGDFQAHHGNTVPLSKLIIGSAVNLADQLMPGVVPALLNDSLNCRGGECNQFSGPGAAAMNQLGDRFNDVMTRIDRDRCVGNERDLFTCHPDSASDSSSTDVTTRGQLAKARKNHSPHKGHEASKGQTTAVAASVLSGNYFAKVELYANSRLPMDLPPLKLYIPTWPLLCLAAQYSDRVYEKARGAEKDVQVGANYHSGTRAMVIKSVPMDHMNTIVFAIRGTATFMDWAVNLNTAPSSPSGFLVSTPLI